MSMSEPEARGPKEHEKTRHWSGAPPAMLRRRSREQQQVAVGIAHDEGARAPRFLLQGLLEIHAGRLVLDEKLTNLRRASDGHRGREKLLALANVAHEHRLADHAKVEPRIVALHLPVERRLAVGEDHLEAELRREERARRLDVGDEQLGFD